MHVISDTKPGLLTNIHEGLSMNLDKIHIVKGNYEYYHYLCDGFDDKGWGCGYRTMQTICSWMRLNFKNCPDVPTITKIQETLVELEDKPDSFLGSKEWIGTAEGWGCGYRTMQTICSWMRLNFKNCPDVPTITKIQETLVELEDKPDSFLGSKEWIGTAEVFLAIDKIYKIPCRTIHVRSGNNLTSIVDALVEHFDNIGSPVMMGGNIDCGSKGIVGIDVSSTLPRLLIVDPHYIGKERSKEFLQKEGWVKWQPLEEFMSSSFYNLCLPQVTSDVRFNNESHG